MKKQRLDGEEKERKQEKTGKRTVFIQTSAAGDQMARDPELDRGSPADVGDALQPGCLDACMPQVSIYG